MEDGEWEFIPSSFAQDCLAVPVRGKRRPDHDELVREIARVRGKMARLKQEIFKPRITRMTRMGDGRDGREGKRT